MSRKVKVIVAATLLVVGFIFSGYYFNAKAHTCATCSSTGTCNACKNCKYCKNCSKDNGTCWFAPLLIGLSYLVVNIINFFNLDLLCKM